MSDRALTRGDRVRFKNCFAPFEGEVLSVFQERVDLGGELRCVFQDELGTLYLSRPSELELVVLEEPNHVR